MTSASRNLSFHSDGLMGYRTLDIDRIADDGVRFLSSSPLLAATPTS